MLFYRLKIWIRVIKALISTFPGVRCKVMDASETVNAICKGKSIIRFGDGEFGLFAKRDIHYQQWSNDLELAMKAIKQLAEAKQDQCPYLLAVPKKYMQCNGFELCKKRVLVSSWSDSRLEFKKTFSKDILYGDAFVFEKKNKPLYDKIWKTTLAENVIFIHNDSKYSDYFADVYRKKTYYVQCPSRDAFENLDEVCMNIDKLIKEKRLDKHNTQLVISAGPAGKVIVYRYSQKGYQCIDTGHCWDDPLSSD